MYKSILNFTDRDLIKLPSCGWQSVEGLPLDDGDGTVWVPLKFAGLRRLQLLRFDRREEFEYRHKAEE